MIKYTARRGNIPEMKRAVKNANREPHRIMLLFRLKLDPLAFYLLNRWLAVDIYPEYKLSRREVSNFIFHMAQQARAEFAEDFPGHFLE